MGDVGIAEIILVLFGFLFLVGLPFTIIALSFSRLKKKMGQNTQQLQGEIMKASELKQLISHEVEGNMTSVEAQLQALEKRLQKLEASTSTGQKKPSSSDTSH